MFVFVLYGDVLGMLIYWFVYVRYFYVVDDDVGEIVDVVEV